MRIPYRFIQWVEATKTCTNPVLKRQCEQISHGCLPWYIVNLDDKHIIYVDKESAGMKRVNLDGFKAIDYVLLLNKIHR
jgi:hypothetical protein